MKIDNVPGEVAFKALVRMKTWHSAWSLTSEFFFSLDEVKLDYDEWNIKWPVEELDNGTLYIPSAEELV